ncbi:MAG: thiamine pyrophosphate-dependent enzyme [Anaerolineae bacterium]|jgi:pyruvate/2-oxoglutarate/acetoin dehydrogenase E1 component/TPP-dependent pyruvate/acetoin dehydrogenase alpha subunit|nr:thiamine pyrophosphate-dependent enzyme [Anaerolineae bacterium]
MINAPSEPTLFTLTPQQIIEDYRLAYRSRQVSLFGRQEVLSGRAKFGIFGDGKELPLLAMARVFEKGDFRSGYYRDQTLMFALGELTVPQYFAQLYAHADQNFEPASGGRMMNAHFVTHSLNTDGTWRDLTAQYNTSADISPTASQMPRLVGLAYASRLYRELDELKHFTQFSRNGDEVAFGIIGNASCAEGMFWESLNAIGVLRAPAVITILDDGYGISVSNKHQITKQDLSALVSGFQREEGGDGFDVYTVYGWNYAALVNVYHKAVQTARESHIPAIIHVIELTQPQGHSTSGSHERYKSEERLQWEREYDGLMQMRAWILAQGLITGPELDAYEEQDRDLVRAEMKEAWNNYLQALDIEREEVRAMIDELARYSQHASQIKKIAQTKMNAQYPKRRDLMEAIFEILKVTRHEALPMRETLITWRDQQKHSYERLYGSHLYSETAHSPLRVAEVKPIYSAKPETVNGFQIMNLFFESMFARDPRIVAFGEDVGFLGGVNQTMAGLQQKYGELRVSDTGIREITIVGQAIGLALRGLRPVAEIQYLDYLLYALQLLSDDLATLHWRTVGRQKAPLIISTRGHRLEGIWHSGSPMSGIINLVRGIHVLVPRDMTRAAGFYNTLLKGDDPGIVVEVLNGYRKKEALPDNLAEVTIPLGMPEILREGSDVTLVTYGALCEHALIAARQLAEVGIDTEVIDVQSLLPFDLYGVIGQSLQKTNRVVFLDEDVPGGTTAYMMQEVLEKQGGYHWLDAEPRTLAAKAHRPAYGSDGSYFSKPNVEDIFEAIYALMHDSNPRQYPLFYK